jgi:hypothetical protein
MNFIKWLFSSSKKANTNNGILNIKRIPCEEFIVSQNDYVNLWNRPETDEINIYAKGSAAGRGKIGTFINYNIADHLRKGGQYKANIVNLTNKRIFLNVDLLQEFKTIEDYRREQNLRIIEQLKKNYNPKNSWTLRFIINRDDFDIKNIGLQTNDIGTTISKIEIFSENIWLVNTFGERIEATNHSNLDGMVKTLRAIFSGHTLVMKPLKKEGVYQIFEIKTAT